MLTLALAVPGPALAQEITTDRAADDRWSVIMAPYIWLISLNGDASVGGIETDVDYPFSDAIQDLTFGAMVMTAIRKGDLGFVVNGVLTRVASDEEAGPFEIRARIDLGQVQVAPFFRLVDYRYRETALGRPLHLVVEPLAGARINWLRAELERRGGRQGDKTEIWVDPIVGARFGIDLSDRLALFGQGDIGGVVTGSDFAWNLRGNIGFRPTLFGRETVVFAGYRAYGFDYDRGGLSVDLVQHGPILGTAIRF